MLFDAYLLVIPGFGRNVKIRHVLEVKDGFLA